MNWLPIENHPDYEVSDCGQVRSHKNGATRILKPQGAGDRRRYRKVCLHTGTNRPQVYIHKLVADAFIGPRPEGMEIRHLDGDPTNNQLSNLAYGTSTENKADCIAHGNTQRGTRMWMSTLDERRVRIIRGLCKLDFPRKRIAEICRVTTKTVSDVYRMRSWAWLE